jgi:tol-pal system protein YbgF
MLGIGYPPKKLFAMVRSAFFLVVGLTMSLAGALWADSAWAQASESELVTRIDRLEASIRDLTGSVEQLQYRNQQLEQQVQRLEEMQGGGRTAAAPPSRPPAQYPPPQAQYSPPQAPVVAEAPPPAPVETPQPPSNRRGDAFDPRANPGALGSPRELGSMTAAIPPGQQPQYGRPQYERPPIPDAPVGPGSRQPGTPLNLSTLSGPQGGGAPAGELPPPPPRNPSATGDMQATLPPSNTPKDEYDLAYVYILHKDYGQAADTFSAFLHKYPGDRLAPEAQYWMGEALFQKQRYRDAAEAFLAVSTKYETTARAPDALLRLGQSLAALGEKEAACASLGEVLRKYPRASLSVKQSVDREQKRAHC